MCSSAICFPVQPHTLSEWSMHHGPVVYSFLCCIVLHWTITAYSATVRVYLFSWDMTLFDFLMLNQLCIIGINLSENCGWIPFADILFRRPVLKLLMLFCILNPFSLKGIYLKRKPPLKIIINKNKPLHI